MKKKIVYLLLYVVQIHANATNYYVATDGNDADKGTSQTTPFRTINKINSLVLKAGDSVLFKRGDVFRGQLNITESGTLSNPIVIAAYGSGKKPIINGSEIVSHWTTTGNNIWQANCPQCGAEVNGLYSNSIFSLPLGRWPNLDAPNEGYDTILSHSGDTSITSQESLTTDWTGATIVARNQEWILDKSIIKSQYGNELIFNAMTYQPRNNWGYFIQNHPATLDENGEWYYSPTDKTIGVYYRYVDPDTVNIEATVYNTGINITGSFITIQNIQIEKTLYCGLMATNVLNLTVQNTTVLNSGDNGIEIKGIGKNIDLENDTLTNINNDGILVTDYTGFICKHNFLKNIATIPGRGNSGDGQYEGLLFTPPITNPIDTSFIENNIIDSVGYIGIYFHASNIIIQNNIISNFDLVKDDGGGIYTYNGAKNNYTNQRVISNIVYNGSGNLYGTSGNLYHGANGIYMDNYTENVEIQSNIVFNCVGGLMLHSTDNLFVIGNTFFNNGTVNSNHGALQIASFGKYNNSHSTLKNNIYFSKYAYQGVAWEYDQIPVCSQYEISDSNYYCRPFDDIPTFYIGRSSFYSTTSLSNWQLISNQDIHSKSSPIIYEPYVVDNYIDTNLISKNLTNLDTTMWFAWTDSNNHSFTWDTFQEGTMELSFTHNINSPMSAIYAGTLFSPHVNNNQTYIVSFDAVNSIDSTTLLCQLAEERAPSSGLSNTGGVLIGTIKKSYTVYLTATRNDPYTKSLLYFKLLYGNSTVYISHVSLRKANVHAINPNDSILFFYNATASNRKYILPIGKNYIDVKKNKYSSCVQLKPFSCIVLLFAP